MAEQFSGDQLQLPEEIDLPVGLIQRTLEAELLIGTPETVLNKRVWIATMTAETISTTIQPGDLVIVGNQLEIQQAALQAGAACLLVTNQVPLDESLAVSEVLLTASSWMPARALRHAVMSLSRA